VVKSVAHVDGQRTFAAHFFFYMRRASAPGLFFNIFREHLSRPNSFGELERNNTPASKMRMRPCALARSG
jgi:hypothetical protein